jgi:hypothetical protein
LTAPSRPSVRRSAEPSRVVSVLSTGTLRLTRTRARRKLSQPTPVVGGVSTRSRLFSKLTIVCATASREAALSSSGLTVTTATGLSTVATVTSPLCMWTWMSMGPAQANSWTLVSVDSSS